MLADQAAGVGDLADVGGDDVPLAADLHELVELLRLDDRAHALLGLGGQDFRAGHALGTLVDVVEHDVHSDIAGGSQLGDGTGQACATEVLNTDDHAGVVQVQAALDEDLLREGVADLHGRELALRALLEVLRREDRHAADTVQAGAGTEKDDAVAGAGGEGELQVLGREHTHAEGVDQWVTAVGSVEDRLAADVRQAEGVTVAADARDHARQDALGIRGVCRAEAQLIHHCDRARTHGHDVADDAAHTGGRALVGLDVRRRVVALDLEGHGPAVADVDHAGVLADAGEHLGVHLLGGGLTEVTQVNLGGLIRAVLRPHHGVHGQLRLGWAAAQDFLDAGVLVFLEAEVCPRLDEVRGLLRVRDGVVVHLDSARVGRGAGTVVEVVRHRTTSLNYFLEKVLAGSR